MFCPRCGKALPPNASFCMSCGQPLVAQRAEGPVRPSYPQPVTPMAPAGAIYSPKRSNKWIWPVVLTCLLVIALLIGIMSHLRAAGKDTSPPLSAVGSMPAPPLAAQGVTMPKNIHDWLDHLRETEDRKNKLASEQASQLMIEFSKLNNLGGVYGMVDKNNTLDPDSLVSPSDSMSGKIDDMKQPWSDVILFFESVPPPPECANLAHTYDSALDEVRGTMGDINDILHSSSSDPNGMMEKLNHMQGQSSGTIDRSLEQSDQMVSQICDEYNTKKWFSIRSDVATPLSASGGGLLPSVPQH